MCGVAAEVLVQITDLHLVAGSDAPEAEAGLRAAAALVGRLDPAPVTRIATGDLTDDGAPEAYAKVRAALDPLGLPVHPIAGNHDERAALRAAFADHPGVAAGAPDAPVQYAVTCGTTRVVLCDSVVPGSPGGALDGGRLAWLAERLAEDPGTPTVVALHHPPVCTGITAMDDISLRPEDAAGARAARRCARRRASPACRRRGR
jgi:3',5'-cyclic-AMP phosphodiesterase